MKFAIQVASCFLALLAVALADETLMTWDQFKAKFNKTFKNEKDEKLRKEIFLGRQSIIAEHNIQYKDGSVSYDMEINEYADMTEEEFSKSYLGFKLNENATGQIATFPDSAILPSNLNWVEKGAVTPIKNQKQCASSYAFSATGAMEGQIFKKTKKLVSLSEQNIIDCSLGYGNSGCYGGSVASSYSYVMLNHGIDTEASYPYQGKLKSCRYNPSTVGGKFSHFKFIPSGDEIALQKAVVSIGPISVGVCGLKFMFYKSGIYNNRLCCISSVNHAMLVVGYGTDTKSLQPYWLVKNSWGKNWGEKGYMRIARNANNMCGIATIASYPIVKK